MPATFITYNARYNVHRRVEGCILHAGEATSDSKQFLRLQGGDCALHKNLHSSS
jgi:hypothetical protein